MDRYGTALSTSGWNGSFRLKAVAALLVTLLGAAMFGVTAGGTSVNTEEVLVRVEPGMELAVAEQVLAIGGKPDKPMEILNGFLAKVPVGQEDSIRAIPGVVSVVGQIDVAFDPAFYDSEKVASSMYQVARNIGADKLWKDGYTGAGIDVAVIDTGVAPLPEFRGRLVNGPDLSFGTDDAQDGVDQFGHGTHLAGIIAGRNPAVDMDPKALRNEAKRRFVGVAPGARIVNMKVAAPDGAVDVSQVIAAIDWVVQNRNANGLNIRVLNLAYGTDGVQDYRIDPLTYAVENAWMHGIVVIVSAGNDGYGSPRLNNPAYDPYVLAVGASDGNRTVSQGDDFIADFSSRGDLKRRPDVLAPGRSIVGLRAPGSLVDVAFPAARIGENLFRGSGTSQATAVTSGAVALLLEQYPALTPDQVKAVLTHTGAKLNTRKDDRLEDGMTNVDLDKAASKVKDVVGGKMPSVQSHPPATGTGSLEAARGSEHIGDGDNVLSGEVDVTGAPWDGRSWRDDTWLGRSWRGDTWLGRSWRSDGWNGRSWRNDAWLGRSWRNDAWLGRSWRGGAWLAAEFVPTDPLW